MTHPKDEYAKAVCYFLAEQLRIRKISLNRAAEIAQKVLDNINLIDTEQDFLRLIKTLSADFEELFELKEKIEFNLASLNRRQLESQVRDFVVQVLPNNSQLALNVLQEAVKDNVQCDDLCLKFPEFKEFTSVKQNHV